MLRRLTRRRALLLQQARAPAALPSTCILHLALLPIHASGLKIAAAGCKSEPITNDIVLASFGTRQRSRYDRAYERSARSEVWIDRRRHCLRAARQGHTRTAQTAKAAARGRKSRWPHSH